MIVLTRAGARSNYGKDTMYHAHARHSKFRNMFTTTDVAEHDRIKAKLLGPYSGRTTQGMEPMYVLRERVSGSRITTTMHQVVPYVCLLGVTEHFTPEHSTGADHS